MSVRELVVLGTASQVPTRSRNHNGYLLRWDGEGVLFDPGEGTQRQMLLAGARATEITRICITHFHGDHCLGLPGVLQRMSLDGVAHAVEACYPASGAEFFGRLRQAAIFHDVVRLRERPVDAGAGPAPGMAPDRGAGAITRRRPFWLETRSLSHTVPAVGYRVIEPDGRRMIPGLLAAAGITGPDIGVLQRNGEIVAGGRRVTVEEVSEPRPGQRFAFIMDTRLCDAAFALAEGADMLVCEATFTDDDVALAAEYGHLTAGQAGRIAADAGARLLVLTHFSQRYPAGDDGRFAAEAARWFGGDVIVASDLARIAVPQRR